MALPNFILNNDTIPSLWYINSILNYLNKIPEEYKENDYKKLFEELTQNLNDSINSLDFERLILFRNKLKFIDKMYNYYDNIRKLINTIIANENIKHIVEEAFIPVDINFKYSNNGKVFELVKSNIKDKTFEDRIVYEAPKKSMISFKTIEAFTRHFPNLSKYQSLQDINPLEIIKELHINNAIKEYFEIIKDKIIRTNLIGKEKYENFYEEKIKNYIMNKIYEKIYPPEPDEMDNKIFKKTISLSWVDPYSIIEKDYIFDNLLPDILNEFEQIHIVKTPYQKLNCLNNIIAYIVNLIKFNDGIDKEVGAEDITPVLNYVSIKAHPFRIYSDLEFIKIFSENNGDYENSLVNFESIFSLILESSAENFNFTQEEYQQKCNNAIKENEIYNKSAFS